MEGTETVRGSLERLPDPNRDSGPPTDIFGQGKTQGKRPGMGPHPTSSPTHRPPLSLAAVPRLALMRCKKNQIIAFRCPPAVLEHGTFETSPSSCHSLSTCERVDEHQSPSATMEIGNDHVSFPGWCCQTSRRPRCHFLQVRVRQEKLHRPRPCRISSKRIKALRPMHRLPREVGTLAFSTLLLLLLCPEDQGSVADRTQTPPHLSMACPPSSPPLRRQELPKSTSPCTRFSCLFLAGCVSASGVEYNFHEVAQIWRIVTHDVLPKSV